MELLVVPELRRAQPWCHDSKRLIDWTNYLEYPRAFPTIYSRRESVSGELQTPLYRAPGMVKTSLKVVPAGPDLPGSHEHETLSVDVHLHEDR